MNKVAKIVRIITVAPICAFILCTTLLIKDNSIYSNIFMYFTCILCLCIIPSISYIVERKFHLYNKFHPELELRFAERKLAIWFSTISYIVLALIVLLTNQSNILKEMVLTYTFSGLFIFIFSIIIHIDPSGHICGFVGPVAFLSYSVSWLNLLFLPLIYFIVWSSLKLKRHTFLQLSLGGIIPIVSLLIAILII